MSILSTSEVAMRAAITMLFVLLLMAAREMSRRLTGRERGARSREPEFLLPAPRSVLPAIIKRVHS
jgi:hypothetical protein